MRETLRRFSLKLFAQTGRFISSKKEMILTYHSIDPTGSNISIHPEVFHWQMAFLKNSGRKGVSLRDYLTVQANSSARTTEFVVLTFDDGFENFYDVVLPILLQYGFTATVFIVTGNLGEKCRWQKKAGIPDIKLMHWSQVLECHEKGIEIGSHTVDHPNLTHLDPHLVKTQVVKSKEHIEGVLNNEVSSFCYPYGNYDENTIDQIKNAGYQAAVTRRFEYINLKADMYELPRLGMNRISPEDQESQKLYFKAANAGILTYYDRTKSLAPSILKN